MDRTKPPLDPKNTVLFKIDYLTLGTEIRNGEGRDLYIEGEIARSPEDEVGGAKVIKVELKIHVKD